MLKKNIKKEKRSTKMKKRIYEDHKMSVLEKYFKEGYLDMPNSKYSAEDRKTVGEWLARDYFLGCYNSLKSPRLDGGKIRITGDFGRDAALYFREKYIKAMSHVPKEFWEAVRKVCIEDVELRSDPSVKKYSLLSKNIVYHQKMLLNLGLERLIEYYLKKNKKSS